MNKLLQQLETVKYLYIEQILNGAQTEFLSAQIDSLMSSNKTNMRDPQCPRSISFHREPEIESFLPYIGRKLSALLGIELAPTYAFTRYYRGKEILERHIDKDTCEISITITAQCYDPQHVWPFWVKSPVDKEPKSIEIKPGDGVLYKGNEIPHWREPLRYPWQKQTFFHFVNANGPFSDLAYDKRERVEFDQGIYEEIVRRENA